MTAASHRGLWIAGGWVRVGWRSQTVGRASPMIPRVLAVRYHITGQRRTHIALTALHPSLQILPMHDRDTQWEPGPRATTHIVAGVVDVYVVRPYRAAWRVLALQRSYDTRC